MSYGHNPHTYRNSSSEVGQSVQKKWMDATNCLTFLANSKQCKLVPANAGDALKLEGNRGSCRK